MTIFTLPSGHAALRLDKVLARETGLGLRRCRYLIDQGLVSVDGRPRRKGDLVRSGQRVVVTEDPGPDAVYPSVLIVARDARFAALDKPGGLHTVAGKESSLETLLPGMGLNGWKLVNRLDGLTSGLVLAARRDVDRALYKSWQEQGLVSKWYLAVVHGECPAMELRGRILDAKRTVVRVTGSDDAPLRWTQIFPLIPLGATTMVLARIFKGRRHQIRAHLAHAGHPILGDPVHGLAESGGLFLHHWRIDMPGFSASTDPGWDGFDSGLAEATRIVAAMRSESVGSRPIHALGSLAPDGFVMDSV